MLFIGYTFCQSQEEEENIIYHRDMRKKNEGLSKESKNELF